MAMAMRLAVALLAIAELTALAQGACVQYIWAVPSVGQAGGGSEDGAAVRVATAFSQQPLAPGAPCPEAPSVVWRTTCESSSSGSFATDPYSPPTSADNDTIVAVSVPWAAAAANGSAEQPGGLTPPASGRPLLCYVTANTQGGGAEAGQLGAPVLLAPPAPIKVAEPDYCAGIERTSFSPKESPLPTTTLSCKGDRVIRVEGATVFAARVSCVAAPLWFRAPMARAVFADAAGFPATCAASFTGRVRTRCEGKSRCVVDAESLGPAPDAVTSCLGGPGNPGPTAADSGGSPVEAPGVGRLYIAATFSCQASSTGPTCDNYLPEGNYKRWCRRCRYSCEETSLTCETCKCTCPLPQSTGDGAFSTQRDGGSGGSSAAGRKGSGDGGPAWSGSPCDCIDIPPLNMTGCAPGSKVAYNGTTLELSCTAP